MSSDSPSRTAELYVRSLIPRGSHSGQDAVVRRLDELASIGVLNEYTVSVWGDGLATESRACETTAGRQLLERVEDFRQWASGAGMSLESTFRTETVRSETADREYTCVQFPTATLAEYEDGALQFVSPCADGDTTITVFDRLDALEDSLTAPQSSTSRPGADAGKLLIGHTSDT